MSNGTGALRTKHNPADCLADIVANAERIEQYLLCLDQPSFAAAGLERDAIERCLERICEAVFRLGDRAETLMPGQPLADIRGMGNRLRHAYDRLDVQIVWNTAILRVPELAAAARLALASLAASLGDTA